MNIAKIAMALMGAKTNPKKLLEVIGSVAPAITDAHINDVCKFLLKHIAKKQMPLKDDNKHYVIELDQPDKLNDIYANVFIEDKKTKDRTPVGKYKLSELKAAKVHSTVKKFVDDNL